MLNEKNAFFWADETKTWTVHNSDNNFFEPIHKTTRPDCRTRRMQPIRNSARVFVNRVVFFELPFIGAVQPMKLHHLTTNKTDGMQLKA